MKIHYISGLALATTLCLLFSFSARSQSAPSGAPKAKSAPAQTSAPAGVSSPAAASAPAAKSVPAPKGSVAGWVTNGDFTPPTAIPEGGAVLIEHEVSNPPKLVSRVNAVYPEAAKARGLAGSVSLEFAINESGAVVAARVVESSDEIFNQSAIEAVLQWRYEPVPSNGRRVIVYKSATILFKLQ